MLMKFQLTTFISHMVQMKVRSFKSYQAFSSALYPTWFRWKVAVEGSRIYNVRLYIPHGSDERLPRRVSISEVINLYIPHGSDESRRHFLLSIAPIALYIPHGSDERLAQLAKLSRIHPLYPTWFRWKRTFNFYNSTYFNLYIPHGSDERN